MEPNERVLRARLAAHTRWAQESDPAAATAKARQAFMDRFEREVDPEGDMDPAERARRAESARKAHFTRLALKSARARRRAKEATATAEAVEAELDELGVDPCATTTTTGDSPPTGHHRDCRSATSHPVATQPAT